MFPHHRMAMHKAGGTQEERHHYRLLAGGRLRATLINGSERHNVTGEGIPEAN